MVDIDHARIFFSQAIRPSMPSRLPETVPLMPSSAISKVPLMPLSTIACNRGSRRAT